MMTTELQQEQEQDSRHYVKPTIHVCETEDDGFCKLSIQVTDEEEPEGEDGRDVKAFDMEWDNPTIAPKPGNVWDKAW